jgi:hypothetical protein
MGVSCECPTRPADHRTHIRRPVEETVGPDLQQSVTAHVTEMPTTPRRDNLGAALCERWKCDALLQVAFALPSLGLGSRA